jgi:uncharacterized protein (DUF1800 family)
MENLKPQVDIIEHPKSTADFNHVARTHSGLTPYTGPWTIKEVRHLLRRTMFGSTKADIDFFLALSATNAVDTLLELQNHPVYAAPPPPLNNYNSASFIDPNCAFGAPWPGTADANMPGLFNNRRKSLKSWWLGLMINQPRSLREKMTLFWHNHFATETNVVNISTYNYKHNQLLRDYAFGNFKSLVSEITTNCAMLVYLNGAQNSNTAPNENYARELQELFTIGKDAQGLAPYAEADVQLAAKVLTGWTIDLVAQTSANGYNSLFNPLKHDSSNKTFSAFYNTTVITGQSGANGAIETADLMNMIFAKDEVALTICRKLYRFFVYYEIDAATEANVIVPLATLFRTSNYDILPVLSTLFKSDHFFDALNMACLIKTPIDFTVGLCREYQVAFPATSLIAENYALLNKVRDFASNLTMDIGDPPNVAGWPAYYQTPLYHELWINSNTLPNRNLFSDNMVQNGYTQMGQNIKIDVVAFTATLTQPDDPDMLIDEVLSIFYCIDTSLNLHSFLFDILVSGQMTASYWTSAWQAYVANPTNTAAYNTVNTRLKSMYKYIMNLSEYQLC